MDPLYVGRQQLNEHIEDSTSRKRHKSDNKKTWHLMDENRSPHYHNQIHLLEVDGFSSNDTIPSLKLTDNYGSTYGRSTQDECDNESVTNIYNTVCESVLQNINTKISIPTVDNVGAINYKTKKSNIELPTDKYPQEGRPILNTSLVKLATQNQHNKGRSPLTTVVCNKNVTPQCVGTETAVLKKQMGVVTDDTFFLYHRKLPQVYYGEDNFAKLSDEIILSIFQWLPKKTLIRCSLVCRRLSAVAQDESLWARLDLACKHLRAGALGKILQRGVIILRLAQSKIIEPILDLNEVPTDFSCKLQYLDLSMAVISDAALRDLLSRCRLLKKLSLEHVLLNYEICCEIAENKHLEALNLTMCDGIDALNIRKMMIGLKSLQSLNISWTSLNSECVKVFVEFVPSSLLRLNIAGCRKSMTDYQLSLLVKHCPGLIELDLSDCTVLTSEAIKILCKLKELEYLSLSRCYNIAVASYLAINELISLAYLDIFGVLSDQAVTMLQASFPSVGINKFIHSSVARPTVGSRRTSIWGLRTRD